jgi:AAA15 family ATPase/GTPase
LHLGVLKPHALWIKTYFWLLLYQIRRLVRVNQGFERMLLRFKVQNFKSLYREQEFSMVPMKVPTKTSIEALPAALIYGPNASGKSNLVTALSYMFAAIRHPNFSNLTTDGWNVPKFKLNSGANTMPTRFEVSIEIEGVRYDYGFEIGNDVVLKEWLYGYPNKRSVRYFERLHGSPIQFGEQLKGRNRDLEKLAGSKGLFLSFAGAVEHEQLTPIWRFFVPSMFVNALSVHANSLADRLGNYESIDSRVISFLKEISSGIVSHRFQKILKPRRPSNAFANYMSASLGSASQTVDAETSQRLELGHATELGEPIYFAPDIESSGTTRLLLLLERAFLALDGGMLLVVDEIDMSLHTLACEAIFQLFTDQRINSRGAQLIATTHDTNLICSPQLGRDQIWFAEKDAQGATEIYPLSDFKVRENDNFERGYLRGRFGALPFSGDPADLFRSMRVDDGETV